MKRVDQSLELDSLLRAMAEAFEVPAWHGPNLKDSVKELGPDEAVWRPNRTRHNIQEIIVHAAFWKHVARNRISGEDKPFPEKGADWFRRTRPDEESLRADLETLEREHRALLEAVQSLPQGRLDDLIPADHGSVRQNILGVAFHDVYHAGQIQLLRRLQGEARSKAES